MRGIDARRGTTHPGQMRAWGLRAEVEAACTRFCAPRLLLACGALLVSAGVACTGARDTTAQQSSQKRQADGGISAPTAPALAPFQTLPLPPLVWTASRASLKHRAPLAVSGQTLYASDEGSIVASHLDYSLVSEQSPARPGDWIILWATGLGPVEPPAVYGGIPLHPARLKRMDTFQVLLDDVPAPPNRIGYAGLAPGWGGLYQVNLQLPKETGQNPAIRLAAGGESSPPGLRIWVTPAAP